MNNKKYRFIVLNGMHGIIMALFVIFGLISGFIISPAWVLMTVWNKFLVGYFNAPIINIYQGILIWGVIALSIYALNNKQAIIGLETYTKLSKEQIKDIIAKARMNSKLENQNTNIESEKK